MSIRIFTLKRKPDRKSSDGVAARGLVNGRGPRKAWEGFTGPNFYGLVIYRVFLRIIILIFIIINKVFSRPAGFFMHLFYKTNHYICRFEPVTGPADKK